MAKKSARNSKPKHTVSTLKELAEVMGTSYDQVRKWSWLPKKEWYGWDLAVVCPMRYKRMEESTQMNKKNTHDLLREKLQKENAKLQEQIWQLEDERSIRRGESFSAAELSRAHSLALAKVRRQLMQAPDMISNMVPGKFKAAVKKQVASHLQNCLATLQDEKWLGDKSLRMIMIEEAERVAPEIGIRLERRTEKSRTKKVTSAK